jgi:hypothetical protein
VLLYGPIGIGKTSVLAAVAERSRVAGRPCGVAERTMSISDVTRALACAYPDVCAPTQRRLRSSLRQCVDGRPAVILLDHVLNAPTAMKGFLRTLRGTRTGVAFAVDADQPRDHARARGLHLTYREIALPPLERRHMRRLLEAKLRAADQLVSEADQDALLDLARGRPGWIVMFAERLCDRQYWRNDRVRLDRLRLDASADVLARYLRANEERFSKAAARASTAPRDAQH